MVKISYS